MRGLRAVELFFTNSFLLSALAPLAGLAFTKIYGC